MKSRKAHLRSRRQPGRKARQADKRVVTGLRNEERTHILVLLGERAYSQTEISKSLGLSMDKVRYEMGVLKQQKPPLIEFVCKRRVRGVYENFYRATKQAFLDDAEWSTVPDALKGGLRGSLFQLIINDVIAALEEGTYDALDEAHMSWVPMLLDEQGWAELVELLSHTLEAAEKIKKESKARLAESGVEGISCTLAILGYASANPNRTAGPPADVEKEDGLPSGTDADK